MKYKLGYISSKHHFCSSSELANTLQMMIRITSTTGNNAINEIQEVSFQNTFGHNNPNTFGILYLFCPTDRMWQDICHNDILTNSWTPIMGGVFVWLAILWRTKCRTSRFVFTRLASSPHVIHNQIQWISCTFVPASLWPSFSERGSVVTSLHG